MIAATTTLMSANTDLPGRILLLIPIETTGDAVAEAPYDSALAPGLIVANVWLLSVMVTKSSNSSAPAVIFLFNSQLKICSSCLESCGSHRCQRSIRLRRQCYCARARRVCLRSTHTLDAHHLSVSGALPCNTKGTPVGQSPSPQAATAVRHIRSRPDAAFCVWRGRIAANMICRSR